MTLANRITFFRLLTIPFFVAALVSYSPEREWARHVATGLFMLAVISDVVDGWVARTMNQRTKLGTVLDPAADKLLVNIAFVFLAVNPYLETNVPKWLPVLVLARDAFITFGAYLIVEFRGRVDVKPRLLGKSNTVLQSASIFWVLAGLPFASELLMVMLGVAVLSWADYVVQGLKQSSSEVRV